MTAPTPFMRGDGRWAALPNQGVLRWQKRQRVRRVGFVTSLAISLAALSFLAWVI